MHRIAAVVAGLSLAMVGPSASFAATINVPGNYPTIQGAINASSNGDVIQIAAGTYCETNLNPGGKAITIQGTRNSDGVLETIIDGQLGGGVFKFISEEGQGSILSDLMITGGLANYGDGIYCGYDSPPTITNCTIEDRTSYTRGGGIYCWASFPIITDSDLIDNTADNGGGLYCIISDPTITGCPISGNTFYNGGGIYCIDGNYGSIPTITDCTISGNAVGEEGVGGIYCHPAIGEFNKPHISNSEICGNESVQINGPYTDNGGNTVADECPEQSCADLNNSGLIDIEDLLLLIGSWGTSDGDCDAVDDTDIEDLL